jgi:hypothetical protein
MRSSRFDGVNADRCRPQVHLAHNDKKLSRKTMQCGERRAILRSVRQVAFAFVGQRSFPVTGYDGRILEQ